MSSVSEWIHGHENRQRVGQRKLAHSICYGPCTHTRARSLSLSRDHTTGGFAGNLLLLAIHNDRAAIGQQLPN